MRESLGSAKWPGRDGILNQTPPIVIDCAHNPYSAETLARSLQSWFPDVSWILIFGSSSDKDVKGMLEALLPVSKHVIVTRSYHPRATAPYALADLCADPATARRLPWNPRRALEQASHSLEPGLGIVATGSIFLVADVREAWAHHTNLDLPRGDWVG